MFQTVRTNYSPYQKNKAGSPKLKPRTGKDQSCFKDGESKGACIGGGGVKFKIMLKKKRIGCRSLLDKHCSSVRSIST